MRAVAWMLLLLLLLLAVPVLASDPPPAPASDIPTIGGKALLPSDVNLPPPPSPDLPGPLPPPPPRATLQPPPVPPGPTWIIHAYQWINRGWVKQPDHYLETTDLKQAVDYCLELSRYQDWYYRANVPLACCDPSIKPNVEVPASAPLPSEIPHITMTVWAFKFVEGKWVKDPKYCWTASEYYTLRPDMLAYAKKLNAIPGWCATTNAPDCVRGQPLPTMAPPAPPSPPAPTASQGK